MVSIMADLPKLVYFQCFMLVLSVIVTVSAAPTRLDPQPEPAYVPEPNTRGTVKLFWNCFTTFILCVWTAVHPDVVPVKGSWPINCYKFFMMTWAIVIPELLLCMAVIQLKQALEIRNLWRATFTEDSDKQSWLGLSGAFFVVMGGYIVETDTDSYHANPIQLETQKPTSTSSDQLHPLVTTIQPKGFQVLLTEGTIQNLIKNGTLQKRHFDHRIIEDKGNANTISKLLVAVQISWMIIQSIGRKLSGLPVTLLEVHVLIQIIYSIAAYCCWWAKPLDINRPIPLAIAPGLLQGHNVTVPTADHKRELPFVTEYYKHSGWLDMFFRAAYAVLQYLGRRVELWASILAIGNGALHLLVWNSYFPTTAERIIWRISGIGLGVFPLMVYFIMSWNEEFDDFFVKMWYLMRFEEGSWAWMTYRSLSIMAGQYHLSVRGTSSNQNVPIWLRYLLLCVCTIAMILYVACILYLTVEAFISMRSLPAGSYQQPPWTSIFPHI
ncbi:hypothetical protein ATERTT37_001901 [Aspergillus terreus]